MAFVDALKNLSTSSNVENVPCVDSDKASRLLENITKGRIEGEQAKLCLISAINLDPYNAQLYACWLDRYGDKDKQLEVISGYFRAIPNIRDVKFSLLQKYYYSLLPITTIDEYNKVLADFEEYGHFLGSNEIDILKEDLLRTKVNVEDDDKLHRTVNDVTYATMEEADSARRNADERTFMGEVYESLEAARCAEEQWENEMRNKGLPPERIEQLRANGGKSGCWGCFGMIALLILTPVSVGYYLLKC